MKLSDWSIEGGHMTFEGDLGEGKTMWSFAPSFAPPCGVPRGDPHHLPHHFPLCHDTRAHENDVVKRCGVTEGHSVTFSLEMLVFGRISVTRSSFARVTGFELD